MDTKPPWVGRGSRMPVSRPMRPNMPGPRPPRQTTPVSRPPRPAMSKSQPLRSAMSIPRPSRPATPWARSSNSSQHLHNTKYWDTQTYRPRSPRLKQFVNGSDNMIGNEPSLPRPNMCANFTRYTIPKAHPPPLCPPPPPPPTISSFIRPQDETTNGIKVRKPFKLKSGSTALRRSEQQNTFNTSFEYESRAKVGQKQNMINSILRGPKIKSQSKEQTYRCEECDVSIPCATMLDSHYNGAKHARKVKELQIANSADEFGDEFIVQFDKNLFKCELCSVFGYSFTHMKAHIDGQKHKAKAQEKNAQRLAAPTSIPSLTETSGMNMVEPFDMNMVEPFDMNMVEPFGMNMVETSSTNKAETRSTNLVKTSSVNTAENSIKVTNKTEYSKFHCDTCLVTANSQTQFDMHMQSQKHMKKLSSSSSSNSNEHYRPYPKNKPRQDPNKRNTESITEFLNRMRGDDATQSAPPPSTPPPSTPPPSTPPPPTFNTTPTNIVLEREAPAIYDAWDPRC